MHGILAPLPPPPQLCFSSWLLLEAKDPAPHVPQPVSWGKGGTMNPP